MHSGSLLVLPSGIYGWQPPDLESLTPADLDPIVAEKSQIDVLIVGTGPVTRFLPRAVRERLERERLGFEAMNTGAAVRSYNVLLAENRRVAAAMLGR